MNYMMLHGNQSSTEKKKKRRHNFEDSSYTTAHVKDVRMKHPAFSDISSELES